jgi:DNA excision repair protein ERCC-4
LRVDTRAGSKELIEPLRRAGLPVDEAVLPFGDIEIVGRGEEDRPILVGYEHKTIADVLSCIADNRFDEQLRGMQDTYEVRWLVAEGRIAADSNDALMVWDRGRFRAPYGNRRFKHSALLEWFNGVAIRGGINVWLTDDQAETVAWLRAQHLWWRKGWDTHTTGTGLYATPLQLKPFEKPTKALRIAKEVDGFGPSRARDIAKHFRRPRAIANATVDELMQVEGIGRKTAERAVAFWESER